MSVARSSNVSDSAAREAMSAVYGFWAPALTQAQEAAQAAALHWRALADLQIKAAQEAYSLASSHAERRREAVTQMVETVWPVLAAAVSKKEAAHV